MPTPLTAISFLPFPHDLAGMADTFIRLRPEHFLEGYGPILTRFEIPSSMAVVSPADAEREANRTWEPRYSMEWWPVGPVTLTPASLVTPIQEAQRRLREHGPRDVDVTPEFVRGLLGSSKVRRG